LKNPAAIISYLDNPGLETAALTLVTQVEVHLRWNTKNAGDSSRAWRVLLQDNGAEHEINVRNVMFQPFDPSAPVMPSTTTSILAGELKGNVRALVRGLIFDAATRDLTLLC
jgi:hypothetical protein